MEDFTMEWYDCVRILQAFIALTAMYFLGRSWTRRSSDYSSRLKDFWWVLSVLLFACFMGPIEQIIRNREESWTLFVTLFATIIALKASLSKERTLLKSDNGR